MIVESCQLLATAHAGAGPYSITHFNHPCAKWVRASAANYAWLAVHCAALLEERSLRWPERAPHASSAALAWYVDNFDASAFPCVQPTPFAQAMPQEFKRSDAVLAYRAYYAAQKTRFKRGAATWTRRPQPAWLVGAPAAAA